MFSFQITFRNYNSLMKPFSDVMILVMRLHGICLVYVEAAIVDYF
jgi:hypothetical protein